MEHLAIISPDAKGRFSLFRWLTKTKRYKVFPTPTGGVIIEPITEEVQVP